MFVLLHILGYVMIAAAITMFIIAGAKAMSYEIDGRPAACVGVAIVLLCWLPFTIANSGNDLGSSGKRIGVVTQFSYTGIPWQSYQGELVMGGVGQSVKGGQVANIWDFSIDNYRLRGEDTEQLVRLLTQACENGSTVEIIYVQEVSVALWRARKNYLVQSVRIIDEP